ncbi:MAG: CsbD family protein [Nocardia sp.]|uniref:CsbD family protein n=1 Tax=Nocardia sp. TaxID=1821 RepID=UPI0026178934|nr:CsbD family protein [Nocardia sp.]MCU1640771.1 CsbD family protein [Nocardia sp.]
MSLSDKIGQKAQEVGGKAKEAAGDITGDDDLRAEGKADQIEAGLEKAADNVKDAVGGAMQAVKDKLGR